MRGVPDFIGCGAYFDAIHNALGRWLVRKWLLPKNGRRPQDRPVSSALNHWAVVR